MVVLDAPRTAVAAALVGAAVFAGCEDRAAPPEAPAPEPPPAVTEAPAETVDPRWARYQTVRAAARAWLDDLEVDPADLESRGIEGTKKLTEILDAYLVLWVHADDEAERAALQKRVEQIAAAARRPGYHDLARYSAVDFRKNGMSYLRAAWVLDRMGLGDDAYRAGLAAARPRFDADLPDRGGWQRFMFRRYYDHFGLEKPALLEAVDLSSGLVDERRPAVGYANVQDAYELAHVLYAAYAFGYERPPAPPFTDAERAYLGEVVPVLIDECIKRDLADLMGELLSGMTYLGWRDEPAARRAIDFLLTRQNPDGTWGSYEQLRPRYGEYVDQQMYLHTVLVSLRALVEVFEGDWPVAPVPSPGS